jgi:sugar/nucleoside kinase (ribokinase family)
MEKEQFVTVFGSANNDLFFKVDRPPQIGETISSKETQQFFGGKVNIIIY